MPSGNDIGKAIIGAAPNVAPGSVAAGLRWIIDAAVDGRGPLPAARVTAGRTLSKHHGDVEAAINVIVRNHISMAGAQGFATNLGGFVVSMAAMPANIAGVAMLQARMVASIAHLRGYDIEDSRVRQAILMTLLGKKIVDDLVTNGQLPGSPLVIATAPASDGDLEQTIAQRVMTALLSQSGSKQMFATLGKRVPVLGGGVGLAIDSWNTSAVARYAREQFVNRRQIGQRPRRH